MQVVLCGRCQHLHWKLNNFTTFIFNISHSYLSHFDVNLRIKCLNVISNHHKFEHKSHMLASPECVLSLERI